MDRLLGLVDVLDEVADPALVIELLPVLHLAGVDERDAKATGEERGLSQALRQDVLRPLELVEDLLCVGKEADRRARLLARVAHHLELAGRGAASELLAPDLPVALHVAHEPFRQRVHHRDADPVQAARHLVALAAELAAGMELRQHHRDGRQPLVRHDVDRDAGAVVRDGDRVVRVERHLDAVAPPGERLVDRVVDRLEDEMVEPAGAGRADVHARRSRTGSRPSRTVMSLAV